MSADEPISVDCRPDAAGWTCFVSVGEGPSATHHQVRVMVEHLDRYLPGSTDPEPLVRESFTFLLEREPKSAILHEFGILDIGRYFPDYEVVIRQRLTGRTT
ncbi:MAG TPA: hypothetical protein VFK38_04120 [Candidatus Limnocylindrales bacterium]|nr:hypothetical protein [Candidatus Limnocylindrales bacterium]